MNIADLPIELNELIIEHKFNHISLINKFYNNNLQKHTFDDTNDIGYLVDIINIKLLILYDEHYIHIDMNTNTMNHYIMINLVKCKNFVFVKYFCNRFKNTNRDNVSNCNHTVIHGRLDMLKYFHKNGFRCDNSTFYYSICNGHLNCLKYLHKHNIKKTTIINYNVPHLYGYKKCIKYAYTHGFECTQQVIDQFNLTQYTIHNGH